MPGTNFISGLVSGLDTTSIIESLVALQNKQVGHIQQQQLTRTTRLSAWTGLKTTVFNLKSAAASLATAGIWRSMRAESGDTDVLTVAGSSSAVPGEYSLTISAIAQAHQIASQGFADTTSVRTGTGNLAITVASTTYNVAITAGLDTLAGVRDAVNAADIGVRASILNTGSGATPYQLVLTSEATGAANTLAVSSTGLTGGTAPTFLATRGAAATGTWSGTSSPASAGTYAGASDKTFTFTVGSSGTVGSGSLSVAWNDGEGGTGSVSAGAGYTAGTTLTVAEGVTVSFAAGTLVAGNTFTVGVTSPTIQTARDAEISIGSTAGGADPLVVTRSSNTVDDLIEGLTLTLKQTSSTAATITVERDTGAVRDRITEFVNAYNAVIDMATEQTRYDAEAKVAGPLLGDGGVTVLQAGVRGLMTAAVPGLSGALRTLSAVGITSSASGQLEVDYTDLDDALQDDYSALEKLFREVGASSDRDITFLNAGRNVTANAGGYAVAISQAAKRATYTAGTITEPTSGSPLTFNSINNALVITVDNLTSGTLRITPGSYASGAALAAEIEAQVNGSAEIQGGRVDVSWVATGGGQGHLEITSERYGSKSVVWWKATSESAYAALGVTAGGSAYGQDVRGTIGGETAVGDGRILTGAEGNENTAGLAVEVLLTPADLASQGSTQGTVTLTRGMATLVDQWAEDVTDGSGGLIVRREAAIQKQIDALDGQIGRLEQRIASRRDSLLKVFSQLETTLARLQNESNYLTGAIGGLPNRVTRR